MANPISRVGTKRTRNLHDLTSGSDLGKTEQISSNVDDSTSTASTDERLDNENDSEGYQHADHSDSEEFCNEEVRQQRALAYCSAVFFE